MTHIRIKAGQFTFKARLETDVVPKTCEAFRSLLPYHQKIIHVRWSGEGVFGYPSADSILRSQAKMPQAIQHPATSSSIQAG